MMFNTKGDHAEGHRYINISIFYQGKNTEYLSPGIPLSIQESEKELRDKLFPSIWDVVNDY